MLKRCSSVPSLPIDVLLCLIPVNGAHELQSSERPAGVSTSRLARLQSSGAYPARNVELTASAVVALARHLYGRQLQQVRKGIDRVARRREILWLGKLWQHLLCEQRAADPILLQTFSREGAALRKRRKQQARRRQPVAVSGGAVLAGRRKSAAVYASR